MSIKKSQAILKCFIDLNSSVWFTLGSEDETMFCDTYILHSRPKKERARERGTREVPPSRSLAPTTSKRLLRSL